MMIKKNGLAVRMAAMCITLITVFSLPLTPVIMSAGEVYAATGVSSGYIHDRAGAGAGVGDVVYFGKFPRTLMGTTRPSTGTQNIDWMYDSDKGKYYKIEPIAWRVLKNTDGNLYLWSEALLLARFGDKTLYHTAGPAGYTVAQGLEYGWKSSSLRTYLNSSGTADFLGNNNFSAIERGVIQTKSLTTYALYNNTGLGSVVTSDKVYLLSYHELLDTSVGFSNSEVGTASRAINRSSDYGDTGNIFTRSWSYLNYSNNGTTTFYLNRDMDRNGEMRVSWHGSGHAWGATGGIRPAANISTSSVVYTSNATGSSSKDAATVGGSLQSVSRVSSDSTVGKKLTFSDSSRRVSITNSTTRRYGRSGANLSVPYTGATTGRNMYVSCFLKNSSGTILYYGKVASTATASSGTASVPLPSGLAAGNYTLCLYSEQANGGGFTDYAGSLVNVPLTIDNTRPTLTARPSGASNDPQSTDTLILTFSESMDTSFTTLSLKKGSTVVSIADGTWGKTTYDNDTYTVPILERLDYNAVYTIVPTTFKDRAGNQYNGGNKTFGMLPLQEAKLTFDPNGGRPLAEPAISAIYYPGEYVTSVSANKAVRTYYITSGGIQVTDFPTPQRRYYDFVGWSVSPNAQPVVTTAAILLKTNTTLYARWERTYPTLTLTPDSPANDDGGNPYGAYTYHYDTDVITAVDIGSDIDVFPFDSDGNGTATAEFTFTDVPGSSTWTITDIHIKAGDRQRVWFKWHTPEDVTVTGYALKLSVSIKGSAAEPTEIEIPVKFAPHGGTAPPDPEVSDTLSKISPLFNPLAPAPAGISSGESTRTWHIWAADVSTDSEDQYEVTWEEKERTAELTESVLSLVPAEHSNFTMLDSGKYLLKSGYGVSLNISPILTMGSGVKASDTSSAQGGKAYFPEYNFLRFDRNLLRASSNAAQDSTFGFMTNRFSTYGGKVHFTPIWFPDNLPYTVYAEVYDAWTPAGELSIMASTEDQITISGNVYQDWHIAAIR